MQKKLLAIAVAGVFAAPVVAQAQTSNVQVYGKLYYEYTWMDQGRAPTGASNPLGAERESVDMMQTPGSEIGLKGEEKLGGGMSAWFQCASTADLRGQSQDGWCSRNSAVGLKGAFGNFWVGNWDTPFKRAAGVNRIVNETGAFGASFVLFGGSTTVNGRQNPAQFLRRVNNSINYDSPNFGGFQLSVATNATNHATSALDNTTANKARLWSAAGTYRNGPLNFGVGYELHKDFYANSLDGASATGTSGFGGDDRAWMLSAGYQFGPVRLGAIYTQQKLETNPAGASGSGSDLKVKAWHLAADWKIAGPHGLRAGYTQSDDTTGSFVGSLAGSGSTRIGNAGAGSTGAKLWQIHYVNKLSKRTEATIGYARLDNDTSATYSLGGVKAPAAGETQDAFGVSLRHSF